VPAVLLVAAIDIGASIVLLRNNNKESDASAADATTVIGIRGDSTEFHAGDHLDEYAKILTTYLALSILC